MPEIEPAPPAPEASPAGAARVAPKNSAEQLRIASLDGSLSGGFAADPVADVLSADKEPLLSNTPPERPSFRPREPLQEVLVSPEKPGPKAGPDFIALLPGWNLVSSPNEPPDPDPAAVLGPIAGELSAVFAYDACDPVDPWKIYDPADPAGSDLNAIDHEIGLWVDAAVPTTLPVTGAQPPVTEIQLCTGWNLIGYPLAQPRPVLSALASIRDQLVRVFGFDPADAADPWEVLSLAVPEWANDLQLMQPGRGYWVLVTEDTLLQYANEGDPPLVEIASPSDLDIVTAPTEVKGTVRSGLLEGWTLSYRPAGEDAEFVEIGSSTAPVDNALLGTFDPTLLLNGLYELRVEATDFSGWVSEKTISVVVEGQMKIGNFTLSFIDLEVPLAGLDVTVIRTYDSRDKRPGDFGVGWTLDIKQGSYRSNRPPGDGWRIVEAYLPCQAVQETKSHLTVVRLSEHEVYSFRAVLFDPASTLGGCFAKARFDFVDGPLPGATLEILGSDEVFYAHHSDEVVDTGTLELFEPEDVRLTTRDGRVFRLSRQHGVTLLGDLNGNQVSLSPTGIQHSSGLGIAFDRDAAGRITRITDPLGRPIVYEYDGDGDLISVTDQAGGTTRFLYEGSHFLTEVENPLGVPAVRTEYDDEGRMIRAIDASGKVIELTHDVDARREVVTNRAGGSKILEYDDRGNVVQETNEEGEITRRSFDADDNVLTVTDPLDRTTEFKHTAAKELEKRTDPLGNVIELTYDERGQVLTLKDPRGNVTGFTYDSRGNPLSATDALGNVTSFTYDSRGNSTSSTDGLGNTTRFEYDVRGNRIKESDALGNETTFTYDLNGNLLTESRTRTLAGGGSETLTTGHVYGEIGRVTSTTLPDGSVLRTSYDLLGRVLSRTDELGRVSTFSYDLHGRLVANHFPDGTSETLSYDAEGRLAAKTDRGGRQTIFSYDAVGRRISTVHPDGATVTQIYDQAGQLVGTTDARGNTSTNVYDGAGRLTAVIDALTNATVFAYDAGGNRTSATDARGNTTTFTYDQLDRLTATTHPDGTSTQMSYDALGRRVAVTDAAGRETRFGYDAAGGLITVTDPLNGVTTYTYDELGNRIAHQDANGQLTRFEYDALRRPVKRILPGSAHETMTYHADGTLAGHTDFNGATRTFAYDDSLRLVSRTDPDGSQVSFTYTATGRRASVTDARGTTSYRWDGRDRLLSKTDPNGYRLSYAYDAGGNRTELIATIGAQVLSTTFSYDALNRLSTVTDPQGEVYTHTYDANGNRAALELPNGVTTTTSYDSLNRLVDLSTRNQAGVVLRSYAYTLAPNGQRVRVDEHDGTSRRYTYDTLDRLTQERVVSSSGDLLFQTGFSHDPVGNRLSRVGEDGDGNVTTTSYTYDGRDRLLSAGEAATYGWDANGNLTSTTASDATATYGWDIDDRLRVVRLPGGTEVRTTYDVGGNRVRTEVEPSGGPAVVTDYLVDTSGPLSHVVAEVAGGGLVRVHYIRGDQLLALHRPQGDVKRYYHSDGSGSIRCLSDETGSLTDEYTYLAFGELLDHSGADPQPYRFAGEPFDPNVGFAYHRARWLDLGVGRFVGLDRFAGIIQDPPSLHKYLYAHVDPINRVDPSGRSSVAESLTVSSIQSTISSATGMLNTAFRIYRLAETVSDFIEYADLARRIIKALSASTPEGAQAALLAEFAKELPPTSLSQLGEAFSQVAKTIGPHWEEMSQAILEKAPIIAGEAFIGIRGRISTYTRLEVSGHLKFVLFLPTGPGGREGDVYVKVNRKFQLGIGLAGGRLFGFGIRTSKANVDQLFRIDWYEQGQLWLHYHILSAKPGKHIWRQ